MKKEAFVKKGLPALFCVVALLLEILPFISIGIFGVLLRSVAVLGCLLAVCAGRLNARVIAISCALIVVGVPIFGYLLGIVMAGGVVFPVFLEVAAYFAVFIAVYCKVCKRSLEEIGWFPTVLAFVLAAVSGLLAVLPLIIIEFSASTEYILKLMALEKRFLVPKSIAFYVALAVLAVRCGALEVKKVDCTEQ